MISTHQISKTFDGTPLLSDINFSIEAGERVSLVGPGGCGKTTIFKILLGLVLPDAGSAQILGVKLGEVSSSQRIQVLKRVGMAFQQGGLFDFMTVAENLTFAMENMTSMNKQQMDEKIQTLLDGVKLGRTKNMLPHELSGGMKRRVGIARALCTDPDIAIFDEPTSGLDPVTSTIIINMIHELGGNNPNAALLVATTNVEIAVRFADRVILVNEGKIAADGPWRELLVDGPEWVRHFLGVRFIGLDREYALTLDLPKKFIDRHWN